MTTTSQPPALSWQSLFADDQAANLIEYALESGGHVLLTPTWIAQAQKAQTQQMFMATERDVLWPMLKTLMADLQRILPDGDARVWAGTALALLNEEQGAGAVGKRVQRVLKDPAATPRGHYEKGMHGYFRGLQFLIKSVFDVALNPLWCQPIAHFVFPWAALPPILAALRAHPDLRQRWEDLHRFYTVATGEPDCVSIYHLLDRPDVQPETVRALAQKLDVPQINRKMGLGVQGLAERFTRHGVIFEHLKETFLPDITCKPIPRESVYAVVNMHSLLYGFEHHGGRIPMLLDGRVSGFLAALALVRGQAVASFFDQFLLALYELVADLPTPPVTALTPAGDPAVAQLDPFLRRQLNAFAANLTSLLELAILSAKQPMKVVLRGMPPRQPSRIYVEAAPRAFFEGLGRAAQTVTALCQQTAQQYGARPAAGAPPDPAAIYPLLADLAERGQFILKGAREWQTIAPLVERLARNPNVTADAYRHWDQDPQERYFLQWCTALASFVTQWSDGTPVQGGDLLFVEGWNDAIVPGRKEPLTNSAWREALGRMKLKDLAGWAIAPV